jgi:hypothetical protein
MLSPPEMNTNLLNRRKSLKICNGQQHHESEYIPQSRKGAEFFKNFLGVFARELSASLIQSAQ